MKVKHAEFLISAMGPDQYPQEPLPEVALAGRSNVGKSSLINRLINRKNLARTSSTPGKTQTLNYYLINSDLYFVDFPGYGYAKVSKTMRQKWGSIIQSYLLNRKTLKLVLLIVDLRHPPSKDDQAMYEWLNFYQVPFIVVATKADKVPKTKWPKHLKQVRDTLHMPAGQMPLLFSSGSGMNKDELWHIILQHLHAEEQEAEHSSEAVPD